MLNYSANINSSMQQHSYTYDCTLTGRKLIYNCMHCPCGGRSLLLWSTGIPSNDYDQLYLNTVCIAMSTVVATINIVRIEIRDKLIEANGYNNYGDIGDTWL